MVPEFHPTELEKNEILSRILSSPEFHDSKRYQELLHYLIDKTTSGTSVKETEIAHDLFGKDSKFDPGTDPLIRSYISNLRKKLEHYYLTTMDSCAYRLEIPKGQYSVKYIRTEQKIEPAKRINYKKYFYIAVLIILITILIFRELQRGNAIPKSENPLAENPIWKEYLQNESIPTLIVLGDYLMLSEKGRSIGRTFLRVPQINSEKELGDYIRTEPGKYGNLEISEVTYIGAGASVGLSQVLSVFGNSLQKVSVKLSHELKWDDFDNHNIIYMGTFKTLYKLDTLFSRTNIRYKLQPNSLQILGSRKEAIRSFKLDWRGGNYQKDYSIILKLLGTKNNSIMFLTGFSEVAVMDAIKSVTDSNIITQINQFTNKVLTQNPLLFEMISETEGVRYTVFRSQIKYFQVFPNQSIETN